MQTVKVPAYLMNSSGFQVTLQEKYVKMAIVVTYNPHSVVELHGVHSEIEEVIQKYKLEDL